MEIEAKPFNLLSYVYVWKEVLIPYLIDRSILAKLWVSCKPMQAVIIAHTQTLKCEMKPLLFQGQVAPYAVYPSFLPQLKNLSVIIIERIKVICGKQHDLQDSLLPHIPWLSNMPLSLTTIRVSDLEVLEEEGGAMIDFLFSRPHLKLIVDNPDISAKINVVRVTNACNRQLSMVIDRLLAAPVLGCKWLPYFTSYSDWKVSKLAAAWEDFPSELQADLQANWLSQIKLINFFGIGNEGLNGKFLWHCCRTSVMLDTLKNCREIAGDNDCSNVWPNIKNYHISLTLDPVFPEGLHLLSQLTTLEVTLHTITHKRLPTLLPYSLTKCKIVVYSKSDDQGIETTLIKLLPPGLKDLKLMIYNARWEADTVDLIPKGVTKLSLLWSSETFSTSSEILSVLPPCLVKLKIVTSGDCNVTSELSDEECSLLPQSLTTLYCALNSYLALLPQTSFTYWVRFNYLSKIRVYFKGLPSLNRVKEIVIPDTVKSLSLNLSYNSYSCDLLTHLKLPPALEELSVCLCVPTPINYIDGKNWLPLPDTIRLIRLDSHANLRSLPERWPQRLVCLCMGNSAVCSNRGVVLKLVDTGRIILSDPHPEYQELSHNITRSMAALPGTCIVKIME